MKKKQNKLKSARRSLTEIVREIGPYMPKIHKAKPEESKAWKIVSDGTLPPINSTGHI